MVAKAQDPNKKPLTGQPIQTAAPTTSQGVGGATLGTQSATATPGGSSSGAFTNIQDYLNANSGAASQNAQGLTQGFGDEAEHLKTETNTASDAFSGGIDSGTVTYNQDDFNTLQSGGTLSDDAIAGLSHGYGAGYSGPDIGDFYSQEGVAGLQNDFDDLSDRIGSLGTTEGRKTALSDIYGQGGSYSGGEQALDSFLINNDPTAKGQIDTFQADQAGLGEYFGDIINALGTDIENAQNTTQATQDAIRGFVDPEYGALTEQANTDLTNEQIRASNYIDKLRESTGSILAGKPGTEGINFLDFVSNQNYTPTFGNTLSPEDLATITTLGAISGQDTSGFTTPSTSEGFGWDFPGFQKAVADAEAAYKEANPTQPLFDDYVAPTSPSKQGDGNTVSLPSDGKVPIYDDIVKPAVDKLPDLISDDTRNTASDLLNSGYGSPSLTPGGSSEEFFKNIFKTLSSF